MKVLDKLKQESGDAASDVLITLIISVCVCAAVIAVLKPAFPHLALSLCLRIEELFSR